jgi:hypothetical protein
VHNFHTRFVEWVPHRVHIADRQSYNEVNRRNELSNFLNTGNRYVAKKRVRASTPARTRKAAKREGAGGVHLGVMHETPHVYPNSIFCSMGKPAKCPNDIASLRSSQRPRTPIRCLATLLTFQILNQRNLRIGRVLNRPLVFAGLNRGMVGWSVPDPTW